MRPAVVYIFSGPGGPDRRAAVQPSEEALGPCSVCGGKSELCTHLPIIRIETGGQTIPGRPYEGPDGVTAGYYTGDFGEEEILVQFSTVDGEGVWHHGDDASTDEGTALFRYRGNSSRWFAKGSFRLKTVDCWGRTAARSGPFTALFWTRR